MVQGWEGKDIRLETQTAAAGYEKEPEFEQLHAGHLRLLGVCTSFFCSSGCIPLGSPQQVSIVPFPTYLPPIHSLFSFQDLPFISQYQELLQKQTTEGQQAEACNWKIARGTLFLTWSPAAFGSRPRALGRKIYSLRAPRCS
uniref:Uncharacterized protein n=1 Tax=Catagonus wagneri TaxID=51154 RepID=A0A8C3WL81_9CETA